MGDTSDLVANSSGCRYAASGLEVRNLAASGKVCCLCMRESRRLANGPKLKKELSVRCALSLAGNGVFAVREAEAASGSPGSADVFAKCR